MLTIKCPEFCPTKEMSSNQDFLSPRRALSWYIHLKGFCTKVFLRINHATTVFSVFVNQNSTNRKPNLGQRRLSFLLLTCVWGGQFPLCSLDEVMSWSHAGGGGEGGVTDHAAIVLAEREGGMPRLCFTSPPGLVPYCWGCPVTERTEKLRRCLKSFQETPTQRKTPVNTEKRCQRSEFRFRQTDRETGRKAGRCTHTSCWKAGWSRSLCRANSLRAFHGGW